MSPCNLPKKAVGFLSNFRSIACTYSKYCAFILTRFLLPTEYVRFSSLLYCIHLNDVNTKRLRYLYFLARGRGLYANC